ncbi:spermatogenesis-associated protein 3 isoform X3 [Mus musculus]|jgi:hypothetical protein|uniref:spermatogenesis-associated protein 3 isoform X3 n=1 Tax=Mus musculus TaxID=10090 RepID=UPI001675F4E0|nr:spermatogenesis-associated protein 3 isoform X3 [Mus musculus]XP_036009442.1 spermatogenesis-associated protein 3 isoform X3 [Mus musculus]
MLQGKAVFPLANRGPRPLGQENRTDMEQRPGEQPSRAPKKEKIKEQPETPSQSVSGRGRVLLIREFFKQDESYTTLPNTQATDCQSSCRSARRRLKRTSDSLADNPEAPAAKRRAKMPQLSRLKKEDLLGCEKPWAPQGNPGSEAAEIAELSSEPGKQLLLVLCHASALDTQLPRLQLLLQQVRVQERRPPAALVGILVQPRPDEEDESRRRLGDLLYSVFSSENPGVEVHTAVFCPSRPQGVLDVQRADNQAHMVHLVDRQTQTDGEGPEGGDWDCCSP